MNLNIPSCYAQQQTMIEGISRCDSGMFNIAETSITTDDLQKKHILIFKSFFVATQVLKCFIRGALLMVNGPCPQISPNMGAGYLLVPAAVLFWAKVCWLCVCGCSTKYRRIIHILSFMVLIHHDKRDEGLVLLIYILTSLPISACLVYLLKYSC